MLLSIGFDPGPRRTAWAVASMVGNKWYFDRWGAIDSTPEAVRDVLESWHDASPLVVVEQIFITPGGNNNAIRDTCQVAGGISWVAEMLGFDVMLTTSTKWRKGICGGYTNGRGTPGDKDVAKMLALFYGQSLPHRSNTHLRDALGIATYAFIGHDGKR